MTTIMNEPYCEGCKYFEPYAESVDDDSTIRLLVCKNCKHCRRVWELAKEND